MLVYLFQFYILLIAWMVEQYQGCNTGWFGDNCEFLCHCLTSQTCAINGQCPNNEKCGQGFFGPGCQYVDVLQFNTSAGPDLFLRDGDDTTCNPRPDDQVVAVFLIKPVPFTWFRMALRDKNNMLNFITTLNGGLNCTNERKFPVSETLVDVSCERGTMMTSLKISGPAAGSICSIYISGGRNVAIKQETNQSTDFISSTNPYNKSRSENAVDGYTDQDYESYHCSHTDDFMLPSWWSLRFRMPQIIHKVVVYNRDFFEVRLRKFFIETYDKGNRKIDVYNMSSDTPQHMYEVNISPTQPVASFKLTKIQTDLSEWKNSQVLTICEVQVFGDPECPEETYGFYCENNCNCNTTDTCHPFSGVCTRGCQSGFYGLNCSSRCANNCLHDVCELYYGNCLRCMPGYVGAKCEEECSPGYFGVNCSLVCSQRCLKTCHPVDGKCACKKEFTGEYCTECSPGYYGPNCSNTCSDRCRDICDPRNGTCTCKTEFTGDYCIECSPGYFGVNCSLVCSQRCLKTCNPVDGKCVCKKEFTGEYCTECSPGYYGQNCAGNCSVGCADICNVVTGNCLCKTEFTGAHCSDCAATFYGPACTLQCSRNCLDRVCDDVSGMCSSCASGFDGDNCESRTSHSWMFIFLLIPFLVLLPFVVLRDKKKEATSER